MLGRRTQLLYLNLQRCLEHSGTSGIPVISGRGAASAVRDAASLPAPAWVRQASQLTRLPGAQEYGNGPNRSTPGALWGAAAAAAAAVVGAGLWAAQAQLRGRTRTDAPSVAPPAAQAAVLRGLVEPLLLLSGGRSAGGHAGVEACRGAEAACSGALSDEILWGIQSGGIDPDALLPWWVVWVEGATQIEQRVGGPCLLGCRHAARRVLAERRPCDTPRWGRPLPCSAQSKRAELANPMSKNKET
jgi:hypothetical protein